jgi:hypothetical protein
VLTTFWVPPASSGVRADERYGVTRNLVTIVVIRY